MDVDDVICSLIYDELAIVDVAGPYISSQCGSCGALGAAACAFFSLNVRLKFRPWITLPGEFTENDTSCAMPCKDMLKRTDINIVKRFTIIRYSDEVLV